MEGGKSGQQGAGTKAKKKGGKGVQGQSTAEESGGRDQGHKSDKVEMEQTPTRNGEGEQGAGSGEWSKVVARKGSKGQANGASTGEPGREAAEGSAPARVIVPKVPSVHSRIPRLLVKTAGSYMETLTKLKGGILGGKYESAIRGARRSVKDELVLELAPEAEVSQIIAEVNGILGGERAAITAGSLACVEIKGMEEGCGEEAVMEGLRRELGGDVTMRVIWLRQYAANLRVALVEGTTEQANRLLKAGELKVGLTVCKVQTRRERPKPCAKCRCYGHSPSACKGKDYRDTCRRCGETGHLERECKGEPRCRACEEMGEENKHYTGSASCKAYQEARAKGWGGEA